MICEHNSIISKKNKNKNQITAQGREIINNNKIKNKKTISINKIEIRKNNISCLKNFILFYYINSLVLITSLNSSYTEIMVTIEGTGRQQILQNTEMYLAIPPSIDTPDEIYINNILQNSVGFSVNINSENVINNVTIKWNHLLTNCREMFFYLYNIKNIYFLNFDTSRVTDMNCMFYHCESLISLDLSIFDTSNVINMNNMFSGCSSLRSLDLRSFDTSKVSNMRGMFAFCDSLISVDLTSFNTSNVNEMTQMFVNCASLTSLNLYNFNTSKVISMYEMFYNCISLFSLDLRSFDTSKVSNMRGMFAYCSSLISVDVTSFNTSNVNEMTQMFDNCISLTSLNLYNFNTSKVISMSKMFYNCSSLISINLINFDTTKQSSISINSIFYGYKNTLTICLNIIKASKIYNAYTSINYNCTEICYKDDYYYCLEDKCPNGYNKLIYGIIKVCIKNCTNDINYKYEYQKMCYKKCPNKTINNNYLCEEEYILPSETIQKNYDNETMYNYDNETMNNYDNETINLKDIIKNKLSIIDNDIKKDEIINDIKNIFTSLDGENLKELISTVKDEQYTIFEDETISIFISTPENENSDKYSNIATINLDKCETILKKEYNIPEKEPLLIYKINVLKEDMKIPKIEYEIYYPLNGNKLEQLDLSKCEDIKIGLSIPITIDKNDIDKYNSSSDYYNNICYKSTTNNGAYIPLQDRKKEYAKNDMYVCEENCNFIDYDYKNKKLYALAMLKIV